MRVSAPGQKKSLELKKHVGLIHSTNRLTLLERKIANALLYNAYDKLLTQHEYQIHIPSLCALIGYNSKDYKTIKQSVISLISTVLEWNLINKGESQDPEVWVASSMLADAKIDGPICTYSYSNRMRELCYYPEFYGRLNLEILAQFKSTYGIALYENCIRYQNITQTPWFDLLTYRKLMGIEEGKYEIFRDLNKRVIKPAVAEVNNRAALYVSPEFKKQGRAVIAIRFLIKKQADNDNVPMAKEKGEEKILLERLTDDYGCSVKQAQDFIAAYSEHYLIEKMALIEASLSYRNGKIGNLSKYLEKALSENYQQPKSSKENLEKSRIKQKKEIENKTICKNKMQDYRNYQNKTLPKTLEHLSKDQQSSIKRSFSNYIQKTVYASVYIKEGLQHPLVRDRFGDFIRKMHPEVAEMLLSFEDFCLEDTAE